MIRPLLYLASPYTHRSKSIKDARFRVACRAAAALIKDGWLAYSPIAHTIPLNEHSDLGSKWGDWATYDLDFLHKCQAFGVLQIPGWRESIGVTAETKEAKRLGLFLYVITHHLGSEFAIRRAQENEL